MGGVDVAGAPAPGQLAHEVELAGDAAQLVVGVDAALERAAPRRRLLDRPVELADHRRRVGHGVAGSGLEVEDRPGGVPDVSDCACVRLSVVFLHLGPLGTGDSLRA